MAHGMGELLGVAIAYDEWFCLGFFDWRTRTQAEGAAAAVETVLQFDVVVLLDRSFHCPIRLLVVATIKAASPNIPSATSWP